MSATSLTVLERAVLDELLAGDHPCLAALRRQIVGAHVQRREWTGVGFFSHFGRLDESHRLLGPERATLEGVQGTLPGVSGVVNFVLFIDGGLASFLEGHVSRFDWQTVVGSDWPESLRDAAILARPNDDDRRDFEGVKRRVLDSFRPGR